MILLDVSITRSIRLVSIVIGDSGETPRCLILGSGAWDRLNERAKKRMGYCSRPHKTLC